MKNIDGIGRVLILASVLSLVGLIASFVTRTPCLSAVWLFCLMACGITQLVRMAG